jgi:hypothetical protein
MRRALADAMIARVVAIRSQADSAASSTPRDVRERLASVGYSATDRIHPTAGRGRLPDPKDVMHLLPQVR